MDPMLGTVGVAPAAGEVRSSLVPDAFGGNMDTPEMRAGASCYLGVNVPGALFSVGDGHYRQGEGESCGTAVEGAMNVSLIVDLVKGGGPTWPRIETDDYLMVVGSSRPLEDAWRISQAGMTGWLSDLYGLDKLDAYQLLTQVSECPLANVVDVNYSSVTKGRKSLLPPADAYDGGHRRRAGRPGHRGGQRERAGHPGRRGQLAGELRRGHDGHGPPGERRAAAPGTQRGGLDRDDRQRVRPRGRLRGRALRHHEGGDHPLHAGPRLPARGQGHPGQQPVPWQHLLPRRRVGEHRGQQPRAVRHGAGTEPHRADGAAGGDRPGRGLPGQPGRQLHHRHQPGGGRGPHPRRPVLSRDWMSAGTESGGWAAPAATRMPRSGE